MSSKNNKMNAELYNINIMRIYFGYGQQAKGQSFWQRLWNNNLGQLLLKRAKEMNINQAAIFVAKAGYLHNDSISFNSSEIPSNENPVCLELIDTPKKLKNYLIKNKALLSDTNIILFNESSFKLSQ